MPKTLGAKLLDFIEHPLAVGALFAVGGLVGALLYTPFLALCAISLLLAFHRTKVVAGQPLIIQVSSYFLLALFLSGGGYFLYDRLSLKLDAVQTEFAKKVASFVRPAGSVSTLKSNTQPTAEKKLPQAPIITPTPQTKPKVKALTLEEQYSAMTEGQRVDGIFALITDLEKMQNDWTKELQTHAFRGSVNQHYNNLYRYKFLPRIEAWHTVILSQYRYERVNPVEFVNSPDDVSLQIKELQSLEKAIGGPAKFP